MNKIYRLFVFYSFFAISLVHAKDTTWTVLIHMETDASLSQWALENLNAMAQAGSQKKKLNILVQLHAQGDYLWRYKVDDKKIKQKDHVLIQEHCGNDIVEGMRWAAKEYPAKNYALILWNHGFGALDTDVFQKPETGKFDWQAEPDSNMAACFDNFCFLRKPLLTEYPDHATYHRGIMLDANNERSYMTNDIMVETLRTISQDVLGKKLGLVGADACKMAMAEICYQIKDYADYFVGAQNCELVDGWPYHAIFEQLGKNSLEPQEFAQVIVQEFENYYQTHAQKGLYTQSAIDLSLVENVRDAINSFVMSAQNYAYYNPQAFQNLVYRARQRAVNICTAPFYTDLSSFFEMLVQELTTDRTSNPTSKESQEQAEHETSEATETTSTETEQEISQQNEEITVESLVELEQAAFDCAQELHVIIDGNCWQDEECCAEEEDLENLFYQLDSETIEIIIQEMIESFFQPCDFEEINLAWARNNLIEQGRQVIAAINNAVIANVTGSSISRARGLSIYFPYNHVESSYPYTRFAQESLWLNFLIDILGCSY
ncbi:hypothetical protein K2W90_05700 [Candidatus Babeliales bacterium]|nr:hypothetical protein [Candidatus Babeliales bacterium]